jgi:hypothetical protein
MNPGDSMSEKPQDHNESSGSTLNNMSSVFLSENLHCSDLLLNFTILNNKLYCNIFGGFDSIHQTLNGHTP